jgi:hypothetical protein
MLHKIFSTVTASDRFEIQSNVSKLVFICDYVVDPALVDAKLFANGVTPGSAVVATNQIAAFRNSINGKISVTRYGKGGTDVICTNIPLADLAEICANNEGMILIQNISMANINGQAAVNVRARFSVELSNAGAIYSDKTDFIVVELDGFSSAMSGTIPAQPATIEVHSLGSFVATHEMLQYESLALNANQLQSYNCDGAYSVALPASTVKALMFSATSELFEVRQNELAALAADVNDIVYLVDGVPVPYDKWRVVPIQLAQRMQIESSANSTAYLLTNRIP